jgi:hypothetical protein
MKAGTKAAAKLFNWNILTKELKGNIPKSLFAYVVK